jgi:hypothetical protein
MELNMKFKALLAAAVMATSSASFASVDDGISQATMTGGELILALWDDVAKKSLLVDTGITFKQLIDNKDALLPTVFDINTVDASYKSFFNNNFTNVYWNAYVASNYSNNYAFDDAKYFGYMITAKDPDFEVANPLGYNDITTVMNSQGEAVSRFNENFVSPSDFGPESENRSYAATSSADPHYLGNLKELWGNPMGAINARGTEAKAGSTIMMIYNGVVSTDPLTGWNEGYVIKFANATFDPTTDSFRINTPLPAAAWLLMSGIAGFGAIARRRKQQA